MVFCLRLHLIFPELLLSLTVRTIVLLLLALPASAADWTLDSFSYFHFPGEGYTAPIASGAVIPLEITQKRAEVWNLRVRASQVPAKTLRSPTGSTLGIALEGDAGGECVKAGGAYECRLQAVFVVVEQGKGQPIRFPITFTTESAGKSAALVQAAREGARLDPESRFLQLVGVSESPIGSAFAPGEPFYIVLSGVLSGLPATMAE